MTDSSRQTLPNAESLLLKLSDQLTPLLKENTALIGIQSGGVLILERLVSQLATLIQKYKIEHGMLDISMHRDDYATRGLNAKMHPSQINFAIQDKHIILIDDVFYTGRTVRAAMNELFDYGRPASITLVTMINRGGRELPITPQITAHEMTLAAEYQLQLSKDSAGALLIKQFEMTANLDKNIS